MMVMVMVMVKDHSCPVYGKELKGSRERRISAFTLYLLSDFRTFCLFSLALSEVIIANHFQFIGSVLSAECHHASP